jgi:hypothetical protein
LGTKVSFALDTLAVNPETNAGVRPENNLRPGQGNFIDNILVKNFNILSMRTRPMIWHSVYKTLQDRLSRGSLSVYTSWKNGFGRKIGQQNKYNKHIEAALKKWEDADPLILKSLLIQESNFKSRHANRHGYAGLAQLGRREAKRAGLIVKGKIDERFIPERAIEGCVEVMAQKTRRLEKGVFMEYGIPAGDEYWKFVAAAYNAGEGTITRATRIAYGPKKPARVCFADLTASSTGNNEDSPLYKAMPGYWHKHRKFKEIKEFAENVVNRARQ